MKYYIENLNDEFNTYYVLKDLKQFNFNTFTENMLNVVKNENIKPIQQVLKGIPADTSVEIYHEIKSKMVKRASFLYLKELKELYFKYFKYEYNNIKYKNLDPEFEKFINYLTFISKKNYYCHSCIRFVYYQDQA